MNHLEEAKKKLQCSLNSFETVPTAAQIRAFQAQAAAAIALVERMDALVETEKEQAALLRDAVSLLNLLDDKVNMVVDRDSNAISILNLR